MGGMHCICIMSLSLRFQCQKLCVMAFFGTGYEWEWVAG